MTYDDLCFASTVDLTALIREKKFRRGMQIIGRRFADDIVLQASAAFEEA